MSPEGLLELARQAIQPVPEAFEALQVLCDALVENETIKPTTDYYIHEQQEAAERAKARAVESDLKQAYAWARTALNIPDDEVKATDRTRHVVPSHYATLNHEVSCARAKQKNLEVKIPAADELYLDIDTPEQWGIFLRSFDVVRRYLGVEEYKRTASSSGRAGRYHVVIKMKEPMTSFERIALQAALGSDPMREILSLMRIYQNNPHPTLLFELPEGQEKPPQPPEATDVADMFSSMSSRRMDDY
jgi:hypothetical protein